ncbi:MAG: VWD domain-containing protein, partial [Bacteroidetes bacterium]|nr:VWD domain-containing protein [Bacteroidota bacterium]
MNWDPIRGEWLANSIVALADKKPIPDRTFPEEFTPYQMVTMIPLEQRRGISETITQGRNAGNAQNANQWNMAEMLFNHSFCSAIIGRSYGDPHLKSSDQATYSFQTVGEFVVAKSTKNHFEVQARQSPQDRNFSLNTAAALNVAGDRLCYYSGDKPDGNFSPWRLNGQPISLNGRTYFLPNGGTLSLNGRYYTVSWPSGENVIVESRSSQMGFVNLTVEVFDCDRGEFEGLLGNANGNMEDDFNGRSSNRQRPIYASFSSFGNPLLQQATVAAEREYLNFLARDFAEDWRVTDQTTLFDYASGSSTASFTDRTFPIEHFTVSDLPSDRREASRRRCQEMGVS